MLGPHYAAALVARDLGDLGPDHQRRFEFVLTFDRDLVTDVIVALIARVNGVPLTRRSAGHSSVVPGLASVAAGV